MKYNSLLALLWAGTGSSCGKGAHGQSLVEEEGAAKVDVKVKMGFAGGCGEQGPTEGKEVISRGERARAGIFLLGGSSA